VVGTGETTIFCDTDGAERCPEGGLLTGEKEWFLSAFTFVLLLRVRVRVVRPSSSCIIPATGCALIEKESGTEPPSESLFDELRARADILREKNLVEKVS
tara:strand:- start:158 stop:457 length:300 start_codon:yes stop_codon:yes gene_type:complete